MEFCETLGSLDKEPGIVTSEGCTDLDNMMQGYQELDKDDLDFLSSLGLFRTTSDGVRFSVKLTRLYSGPAIRAIKEKAE